MDPELPSATDTPLNPAGPLCRVLRSPSLLRHLFHRLGREKQRRLFQLLRLDRNNPVSLKLVIERWLAELDTPAGRQRFADRVTPFPRLLIEYVEAQSASPIGRFNKYIQYLETKRVAYSQGPYVKYTIEASKGAKRALMAEQLTSEFVAKIISQNQGLDFVWLYLIGWALAQPNSTSKICRHFLEQSPEFSEALLGKWDETTFAEEWKQIEEQQVLLAPMATEPREGSPAASSSSDADGLETVSHESAASPTPPNIEAEPAALKSQLEISGDASLVPSAIQELLQLVLEREQILERVFNEKNFNQITKLGQDREEAIAVLREALGAYYTQAKDYNIKFHDIINNKRNYASIYAEVIRLFSSLAEEDKRTFEASRRKLLERLKAADLQHLWEEPASHAALQAMEQCIEPRLRIHEAAAALITGRVPPSPSALPNLSTEERVSAAELAVMRVVHDADTLLRHGIDLSPLARLLLQTGICRERPDLVVSLLMTFAKQREVPRKLAEPLVQLAFAATQAIQGRTGWELLLIDARLAMTLADAPPDALDALLVEWKGQPAVLELLASLGAGDSSISKLVVALVERLRARGERGEAIQLLAAWIYLLDPQMCPAAVMASELRRLRDHLWEDDRQAEAMLLVTRALKAGHISVADEFEERLTLFLLSMTKRKDGDAQRVLEWALNDASWLVEQGYGVVAFLYICHLADLPERVLNARFQYADVFEKACRFYPVLVAEFFLGSRFAVDPGSGDDASSYASRMLEELNAFRTGLLKRSCYRSWPPAEEYQRFFNARLEELFEELVHGDLNTLTTQLALFDPETLIEEATREIGETVRHPAIGLMRDYLHEQLEHLRQLGQARQKFGGRIGLEEALRSRAVSMADRLNNERAQKSLYPLVDSIYQSLAGASRSP